ncbi:MAG: PAS domain S-box protein, partial [Chlorobi bacterium]|nr:PAS domain S-box protein [Chlorobiota bacterium]
MKRKSYHFLQKSIIIILLFIIIINALLTRISTRNTLKIIIPLTHKISEYRNIVTALHLETEKYIMLDSSVNKNNITRILQVKDSVKAELCNIFMQKIITINKKYKNELAYYDYYIDSINTVINSITLYRLQNADKTKIGTAYENNYDTIMESFDSKMQEFEQRIYYFSKKNITRLNFIMFIPILASFILVVLLVFVFQIFTHLQKKYIKEINERNSEYESLNEEYLSQNEEIKSALIELEQRHEVIRRINSQLIKIEKRYKKLIDISPVGIVLVQQGIMVYVNEKLVADLGYENANELINKPILQIVHPDYHNIAKDRLKHLFAKEGNIVDEVEEKFVKKDGTAYTVLVVGSSTLYNDKPTIQGFVFDIEDRKKFQNKLIEKNKELLLQKDEFEKLNNELTILNTELKKSYSKIESLNSYLTEQQATMESIFLVAPDGIGMLVNSKMEFLNQQICKISGYSSNDLLNKDMSILFENNEIYENTIKDIHKNILTNKLYINEIKWKTKDGKQIDVRFSATPLNIYDPSKGIIFTALDITDKKKSSNIIKEQSKFLTDILKSLTHPFLVIDAENYNIVLSNLKHEKNKYLHSEKCYEILHNNKTPCDCLEKTCCPLKEVKKTKKPIRVEHVHYTTEGQKHIYEVFGYPIFNENNEVKQLIEYSIDITNRKTMEKELIAAKDKAEESDRLKSAFLANMSHEIRTPMNAIVGFSALLTRQDHPPEKKKFFANLINKSCDNLLHLIGDIIDISKIEAGQITLHKRNINVLPILQDLFEEFSTINNNIAIQFVLTTPNNVKELV